MEYPENCLQCSFVRLVSNHYYCGCNANCMLGEYVEPLGRHPDCPLVELPVGHGRLVDADAYSAEMKKRQDEAISWKDSSEKAGYFELFARADQAINTFAEAKLTLDKMETIVEAEGDD